MDSTPRLQLPYIAPQQAQKQVTYNEAMRRLDRLVQPVVSSRSLTAPPAAPAAGESWIVPPGAAGDWAGQDGALATWLDGGWRFDAPVAGQLAFVRDAAELVVFVAGAWQVHTGRGGSGLAHLGVNTDADATNRLTVAAPASLFTHAGADHRLKLNKAAPGDTASLVFQTGWSGRAEFGLTGDDDFRLKVSPDGAGWHDALVIAAASGRVALPGGQLAFPPAPLPSADPHTLDAYAEGDWTPALSFGGASTGIAYGAPTAGRCIRIGAFVQLSAVVTLTSRGSATGPLRVAGLPFAALAGEPAACCSIVPVSGLDGTPSGVVEPGSTTLALHDGGTPLTESALTDQAQFRFSLGYAAA